MVPGVLRILIFLFVIAGGFPADSYADHEGTELLVLIVVGGPAALGTTVVAPLVGLGIDKAKGGENSPYWEAVGFTLLAASAGAYIAYNNYDDSNINRSVAESIVFPAVAGTVATTLVYTLWPRSEEDPGERADFTAPMLRIVPTRDGGRAGFIWSF